MTKPAEKRYDQHFRVCLNTELADFVRGEADDASEPASTWIRQLIGTELARVRRNRATIADVFGPEA